MMKCKSEKYIYIFNFRKGSKKATLANLSKHIKPTIPVMRTRLLNRKQIKKIIKQLKKCLKKQEKKTLVNFSNPRLKS
jgi:hypothetical protein